VLPPVGVAASLAAVKPTEIDHGSTLIDCQYLINHRLFNPVTTTKSVAAIEPTTQFKRKF
jgi:hypothetical protein